MTNTISLILEGLDSIDDFDPVDLIDFFRVIRLLGENNIIKSYFDENFFPEIFDYLVVRYLSIKKPFLYAVLHCLGVIEKRDIDASSREVAYTQIKLNWSKISDFLAYNNKWAKDVYGWGGNPNGGDAKSLDYQFLIDAIALLLESSGHSIVFIKELTQGDLSGFISNNPSTASLYGATMPIILDGLKKVESDGTPVFDKEAGLKFLPFGDYNQVQNLGFALSPYVKGDFAEEYLFAEKTKLKITIGSEVHGLVYFTIQPSGIETQTGGSVDMKFVFEIKYAENTNEPISLIIIDNSYVKVNALKAALGGNLKGDFYISGGAEKLAIKIDLTNDAFLGNFISEPINIEAGDLSVKWHNKKGVSFEGGNNIAIVLPTHIQAGPLFISALGLGLNINNQASFIFDISGKLGLGPLKVSFESVGFKSRIEKTTNGLFGNYSPLVDFKPPNGLGLSLDAGPVKGGGYLYLDVDREEYAGVLELVFSEWIALKAIGLITTKMPDGSKGFSLLIIITVEFGTGFQLGFGFTLLGVGGILGLNRTVNIDPLKESIRTGAIESMMFPQNVIENAPRIISDLRRFFPVVQDQFLVGPMAKIGWGTPTLVTVSLGVIIEFPTVAITILGVIKVALPTEEAAVLKLQVNFIGRIEPQNKLLWFYAELFDSRILFLTIEGGMGLLVNWGEQANFVFSVGGFHPQYAPPPLPFHAPPRLAITILNETYARIRIEGYFAVTSNSVQFGARVELFFGVSAFNIEGYFGFDALFQFDPFRFSFSLTVSLSVKLFGFGLFSVGFSGLLEGPTPWHIKGEGHIGFLFFSISVPFEETWGENQTTELPPVEVLPLLQKEFEALTNWEAVLPAGNGLLVTLRKMGDDDPDTLVLHPVGHLRISQRKIPLDIRLEKVGTQKPGDVNRVTLEQPEAWQLRGPAEEQFAIGQFTDLDNTKKLSSPGFQLMNGGINLSADGNQRLTSLAVKRVIRYETVILDTDYKRHVTRFFEGWLTGLATIQITVFNQFLAGSAVSQSVLSRRFRNQLQPFNEVIQVQPQLYSVASTEDNRPLSHATMRFTSQASALNFLQQQFQDDPGLAQRLHVIPNTEINLEV